VRIARRILERAPAVAAVAGGGDDERPRADGDRDHRLEHRVPERRAEAEVDDARSAPDRSVEALDDVADGKAVSERAGIPDLECSLRIDADQAEAVHRRRRDRCDGGSMLLELGGSALRVQQCRRGAVRELRVRDVDTRVDHRQQLPRAGRDGLIRADDRNPPLVVFGLDEGGERLVGREIADQPVADEPGKDAES
jgi:hypothetical protein